uniref:Uncharacterized protein n=1 Tax=Oryza meridionalis TaxID=40149 RepID=A0A0E0EGG2_9ORYZ
VSSSSSYGRVVASAWPRDSWCWSFWRESGQNHRNRRHLAQIPLHLHLPLPRLRPRPDRSPPPPPPRPRRNPHQIRPPAPLRRRPPPRRRRRGRRPVGTPPRLRLRLPPRRRPPHTPHHPLRPASSGAGRRRRGRPCRRRCPSLHTKNKQEFESGRSNHGTLSPNRNPPSQLAELLPPKKNKNKFHFGEKRKIKTHLT